MGGLGEVGEAFERLDLVAHRRAQPHEQAGDLVVGPARGRRWCRRRRGRVERGGRGWRGSGRGRRASARSPACDVGRAPSPAARRRAALRSGRVRRPGRSTRRRRRRAPSRDPTGGAGSRAGRRRRARRWAPDPAASRRARGGDASATSSRSAVDAATRPGPVAPAANTHVWPSAVGSTPAHAARP